MTKYIFRCLFIATILLVWPTATNAQIRITELSSINTGQITDEDGDQPDWIEIHNAGGDNINLFNYAISDKNQPNQWKFPSYELGAGNRVLIYASGKNKGNSVSLGGIDHWETAIFDYDLWRGSIGTQNIANNWINPGFNVATWTNASGGFGYGDGDDVTLLAAGTVSYYMRKDFTVTDKTKLKEAIISIDYDDAYIAYLNGVEIGRSNNIGGTPPAFDALASSEHEATLFGGGVPDQITLNQAQLESLLTNGVNNVLAIQVHNVLPSSSDFTARAWLHFGVSTAMPIYSITNPSWFISSGGGSSAFHTNFKLNTGESVTLYDPNNQILDSVTIAQIQPGNSMMRLNDDGQWCFTDAPTPINENGSECAQTYCAAPVFSLSSGFYTSNQVVSITGVGEIRYSTDGSIPTETSLLYTNPIQITEHTVVRARCFKLYTLDSKVATATYFINEQTTLPVVSIALPPDDFDDVYTNYSRKGSVSVEYFDQNKVKQFEGDFAGYVVGNWSVGFLQKSLQFDADEKYGSLGEIKYPLFADDKPVDQFHGFRIRNEDDDATGARMRDRIVNELAAETHSGHAAYGNVIAFINGEYWGHYVAREDLDKYFCRNNYGADPDSVNMVKTHFGQGDYLAEYGTIDAFIADTDFIINNDMTDATNYAEAQKRFDLNNFIDYFATEIFVASTDWLQDYFNNIRLFKSDVKDPWKFILWDVSYSSGGTFSSCPTCDLVSSTLADDSRYGKILNQLLLNPEFKRLFVNRFADLMNTEFLPARAQSLIDINTTELSPEIQRHHERWDTGDLNHWQNAVATLKSFYDERPANQRQHLIDNFELDAEVNITLEVNPPEAGVIKISTIIPENLPWTGIYFSGNPVTITALANPGYTFSNWNANTFISDLNSAAFTSNMTTNTTFTANFTGNSIETRIILSEINYNSDPTRNSGDWFELYNRSTGSIDISNYSISDGQWYHRYIVPIGTVMLPESHLVLFENDLKFTAQNPTVTHKIGPLPFELSDNEDEITLSDRNGNVVAHAAYNDNSAWPCTPDGFGRTLESIIYVANQTEPQAWFDGCVGGSPAQFFSECQELPTLSEINYRSADDADAGDWIELYNPSTSLVDISGWKMRDSDNNNQFTFGSGTILAPMSYLVLYQNTTKFNAQHPSVTNKTGPFNFGLSGDGDLIRLFDANNVLQLSFCYRSESPWETTPNGGGYTLEYIGTDGRLNIPLNWIIGCKDGSPGKALDPDCIVSVSDAHDTSLSVHISPNPTTGILSLEYLNTAPAALDICNALGQKVQSQVIHQGINPVDIQILTPGVYWFSIRSEYGNLMRKVILH